MKVRCIVCDTDDIPETDDMGLDTTARDHLRIWHPDEWFSAEMVGGVIALTRSNPTPVGNYVQALGPSDSDESRAGPS